MWLLAQLSSVLAWVVQASSHEKPAAFKPEVAEAFAALSQAAHCGPDEGLRNWTCRPCRKVGNRIVPGSIRFVEKKEIWEENSTFVLVARLAEQTTHFEEDGCVVSIRGSETETNWLRDYEIWRDRLEMKSCPGCWVQAGWHAIWVNVKPRLIQALADIGCVSNLTGAPAGNTNVLYITGHSLGAAVGTHAIFDLQSSGFRIGQAYIFESPRVGDAGFAAAFDEQIGEAVPFFRITHGRDPVPHFPPEVLGYRHVRSEVYYDEAGQVSICPSAENASCANRYSLWQVRNDGADHCSTSLAIDGNICRCPLDSAAQVVV